jgi:hypothetical protein
LLLAQHEHETFFSRHLESYVKLPRNLEETFPGLSLAEKFANIKFINEQISLNVERKIPLRAKQSGGKTCTIYGLFGKNCFQELFCAIDRSMGHNGNHNFWQKFYTAMMIC